MKLSEFEYTVPQDMIALHPLKKRDKARMLVINNTSLDDCNVYNIIDYIHKDDLIIFNDTKVIPARLVLYKGHKQIQIYLDKQRDSKTWFAYAKPGKKLRVGDTFDLGWLKIKIIEKVPNEKHILVEFEYNGDFFELLDAYGHVPLPPYIEKLRKPDETDKLAYQTVFAKNTGSVAAPTASLHFTEELLDLLRFKGVKTAFVTLHVGSGTFMPVSTENIEDHKMHEEYCELTQETVDLINKTKAKGNKVIAVGSTSMRTVEACANARGIVSPYKGWVDIFIRPGYKFKIIDILLTNFHLPKTSLLMLVAAFGGYENIMQAYEHAIKSKYRFYSYGDCCLIYRKEDE